MSYRLIMTPFAKALLSQNLFPSLKNNDVIQMIIRIKLLVRIVSLTFISLTPFMASPIV